MIILLSPSKKLDEKIVPTTEASVPEFLDKSEELIKILRKYSKEDIAKLMKLSDQLADLNRVRYKNFQTPFNSENSSIAGLMFRGNVYDGLDFESLTAQQRRIANKHIRILSGLYGVLKPFDLMQAYRLEMGTSLANAKGNNLYDFWKDIICKKINDEVKSQKAKFVLNLASGEYFKAAELKKVDAPVIAATFKENKNGKYKMIMPYVKKARGLMARYVVEKNISDLESLKSFDYEAYKFSHAQSDDKTLVFVRG